MEGMRGAAHGRIAHNLAARLGREVMVVPRVYADELAVESPDYLRGFVDAFAGAGRVFYCGEKIVSREIDLASCALVRAGFASDAVVVWDNFYANDYCPRRLFVGAWQGRANLENCGGVMLNPTGMIETDLLLLGVMDAGADLARYEAVLRDAGVPPQFELIKNVFGILPLVPPKPPPRLIVRRCLRHCLKHWMFCCGGGNRLWRASGILI